MQLVDPIAQQISDADVLHYQKHGWVLLSGFISAAQVEPLRAEVLDVLRVRNMPDSWLAQTCEYLSGGPLHALVNSATLAQAAAVIMDGESHVYLPFTAVKGPQQGPFGWHQDGQYTPLRGPACNCWCALQDIDKSNGCLRMVDASHRDGILPHRGDTASGDKMLHEPERWIDMEMQAGDVLIFDRLTVHSSGANASTEPRVAYAVQYHRMDTEAYIDGSWALLTERPKHAVGPVAQLSRMA